MGPRSEDPKLIIRVIIFELVEPICPRYVNVTDRRTDGRTDGRTTYDSNTALALRASRGKKAKNYILEVEKIGHSWTVAIQHFALLDLSSFFPPWLTFPSAFPVPPISSWFRLLDGRCWVVAWFGCTDTTTPSYATSTNDVCCAESRWDQFFIKQQRQKLCEFSNKFYALLMHSAQSAHPCLFVIFVLDTLTSFTRSRFASHPDCLYELFWHNVFLTKVRFCRCRLLVGDMRHLPYNTDTASSCRPADSLFETIFCKWSIQCLLDALVTKAWVYVCYVFYFLKNTYVL